MLGIYIHIPFCKSRCLYCDFYSTTRHELREAYLRAFVKEIRTRKNEFIDTYCTIYFGGGTPSLLSTEQINSILSTIADYAPRSKWKEVTLEANPGDLSLEKLKALRQIGINRLSIGIQSFNNTLLQRIGRRHNATEAIEAVHSARQAGFENISIDLMYGLPGQTMEDWVLDLEMVTTLPVQHVSAYCLTYEPGTPLYAQLDRREVHELADELVNCMQEKAAEYLKQSAILQYEVSNYAKVGFESKHNSNYWNHTPYVGLGAGAHSFNGVNIRQWNPDDIDKYISSINNSTAQYLPAGSERLTDVDIYNEMIMLGLRTCKGVDCKRINSGHLNHFLTAIQPYINNGMLVQEKGFVRASGDGWHILNRIIEDIMI